MEKYIIIRDFMVTELNLKGNDLLAYALIDTCTQDGDGSWHGGYERLAERLGVLKRNAIRTVQRLIDRGLVVSVDASMAGNQCKAFSTTRCQNDTDRGVEMTPAGVSKRHLEGCQNDTLRGVKTTPNNKYNNKEDNNIIRESKRESLRTLADFVRMTDDEYAKLVALMGERKVAQYIEDLNNWKGGKGMQTKSDYFTIRAWYSKDKKEEATSSPVPQHPSSYDLKARMAARKSK